MHASLIRLVLKEQASRGRVTNFVWKKGWTLHDFNPGNEQEPYEYIWYPRGRRTFIHYVEDPRVGARYLAVRGEDREPILDELRAAFPVYTRVELLGLLTRTAEPEALARWVGLAGITAIPDDFDPELFAALEAAARHPAPRVRAEVTRAAVFAAWRELRELLEALRADADPEVRRRAEIALEALARNDWQETR